MNATYSFILLGLRHSTKAMLMDLRLVGSGKIRGGVVLIHVLLVPGLKMKEKKDALPVQCSPLLLHWLAGGAPLKERKKEHPHSTLIFYFLFHM